MLQSPSTVRSDTPNTPATSLFVKPAKKRSSTILLWRWSMPASLSRAASRSIRSRERPLAKGEYNSLSGMVLRFRCEAQESLD